MITINSHINDTAMESSTTLPCQSHRPIISGTPSMVSVRMLPRASSSKRIRSDLLNKLGIVDSRHPACCEMMTSSSSASTTSGSSLLGHSIKFMKKTPLKGLDYDDDDDDDDNDCKVTPMVAILDTLGSFFKVGSPSTNSITCNSTVATDDLSSTCSSLTLSVSSTLSSSSLSSSFPPRRKCLTFNEEVSVVTIPRRDQYSNRMQQQLWHTAEQLQMGVQRATIEFAADGWKWQDIRTDEQHVVCPVSGELVHPVHFEIARLIRIERGLPDDAPVWTPFIKEAPLGLLPAELNTNMEGGISGAEGPTNTTISPPLGESF